MAAIAPFWDDLVVDMAAPGAGVFWQIKGSGASQYLVVQWNNVRFKYGTVDNPITFQAILHENNGSPYIQFNYRDLEGDSSASEGRSATAGIKASGAQGANRLLLSFNAGPHPFMGSGVSTRIAVGLAPDVETPDYYAFTLAAGERTMLALKAAGGSADVVLLNPAGSQIATGIAGPTNVDRVIEFTAAAPARTPRK